MATLTTAAAPARKTVRPFHLVAAAVMLLTLPLLVYYLWVCVQFHRGTLVWPSWFDAQRIPGPTFAAVVMFGAWLLLQTLLQIFAPGPIKLGTPLANGTRLSYRMNGWFSFWFTLGLLALVCGLGWLPAALVYDHFGPLLTTVNLAAYSFSGYLFLYGLLFPVGERTTGNAVYDYFLGTALNPRIGTFDFKFFCESRPGLIGWVVVNLSLAAAQVRLLGYLSTPMILVQAFQFLYVADYFWHEEAILTTWDIKHENFGWMLCWGDLVWVPFTYTLQAFYLIHNAHELPAWGIAGLVALNLLGYGIFRGANIQKHRFRSNPEGLVWGRPPEFIATSRGTLLLTSGWWGIARHMNYLGDLIMALAWCLPCLFGSPLPYFYFVYFTILLVHRQRRDDATCREKYGPDWEKYCTKVRWRILPGVY